MGWNSLRWRLPLSYALIALITAVALAVMLLSALHSSYVEQERRSLLESARTIGIALQRADHDHVQAQVETFSFITQTRVQLRDAQRNTIADSGVPLHQTLTLRAVKHTDSDGPGWVLGAFWLGVRNTEPAPEQQGGLSVPGVDSVYGLAIDPGAAPPTSRSAQRVTVPYADETGDIRGYVELSEGPAYGQAIIQRVAWGLLHAGCAAMVLAAGLGWLISRRISTPVVALVQTTQRMTRGDLATRAAVARRDEIGVLAAAFNEMAARIEATITALRSFVSDAAHELHTPLTALHTDLELAVDDPDPVQRAAHLARAFEQMRRVEDLTTNLLNLSRLEGGMHEERHAVDVARLVGELSEIYASRAEQAGSTLQLALASTPMRVHGSDRSLRQAVGNVLDNAIKFTPPGGQIHVQLYQDQGRVVIAIQDTGIGIPDEDLPQVFRRFHRSRNAAAYPGSGLGLAIAHSIIHAHGGTIEVQSSGEGTCCRLLLG